MRRTGDRGDSRVTVPHAYCHYHKPSKINGLSVVGDSSDSNSNSRAGEEDKKGMSVYAYMRDDYYGIYGVLNSVTSVTKEAQSLIGTGFSEVTVRKKAVTATVTTVTKTRGSNGSAKGGEQHDNKTEIEA